MTSTKTTIRYSKFYGQHMVRVWDVHEQHWKLYSLYDRIPDRILASLPAQERERIARMKAVHS